MITGSYSTYSGPPSPSSASSSSSTHFAAASGLNKIDGMIQQILEAIRQDPFFSNTAYTARQCLIALRSFFSGGGNPATRIPEIRIGNEIVRNISCLDFVYRLSKSRFEGLTEIHWENLEAWRNLETESDLEDWELEELEAWEIENCGKLSEVSDYTEPSIVTLFAEVFRMGFQEIDKLIASPISIVEIAELIHCIFATDPYCSLEYETGNRILNLVSKFLDSGGSPTMSIENIRFGNELSAKRMIFELVYLLWQPVGDKGPLPMWIMDEWKFSGPTASSRVMHKYDPEKYNEISQRFAAMIDRCDEIIHSMLTKNQLADEDFLPLIRCAVAIPKVRCLVLGDGHIPPRKRSISSEDIGKRFIYLMTYFVHRRADPNLNFPFIVIGNNIYRDLTCFHVTYLIWKHPKATWSEEDEQKFQSIFQALMLDPRTDLTLRFSEHKSPLSVHHFYDKRKNQFIQDHTGYYLERITLAHYAVIINDYDTLRSLLTLEPRLMMAVCCLTKGKILLLRVKNHQWVSSSSGRVVLLKDLETDDQFSGSISIHDQYPDGKSLGNKIDVHRTTKVTLLHLAARTGHEGSLAILASLGSGHVNLAAVDSDGRIPQHYLQRSIEEEIIQRSRGSGSMLKVLEPVTKLYRALPQVHLIIHREGYDLHYNTSKKVADFVHQRLGRDSFGAAKRTHHRWINNLDIPELNRVIDNDYKGSGYDRGHLVPAEDATHSDQTMGDTFHPENAVPQNPNMNSGVWSRLEAHVRTLAHRNDLVEVFTGPLFVPLSGPQGRVITYPVMGMGDVHVPTHLFKIIFIHNRRTTAEVYIIPNETQPPGTKFSVFKYINVLEAIDFIQCYSGILFREWINYRLQEWINYRP